MSIDTFVDDYLPGADRGDERRQAPPTPAMLPAVVEKTHPGLRQRVLLHHTHR